MENTSRVSATERSLRAGRRSPKAAGQRTQGGGGRVDAAPYLPAPLLREKPRGRLGLRGCNSGARTDGAARARDGQRGAGRTRCL